MQYFWLVVMVVVLLAVSVFFAWRQVHTLRWLKAQEQLSPEDRTYYRRRSYRRLVGCVLTLVLALLLSGLYFFDILDGLDRLVAQGVQAREEGLTLTDEERAFLRFSQNYVASIGLVLLVLIGVAFIDTLATRRFGMRHRKRIRDDRMAMLQRQLPLLRRDRNGSQG